MSYGITAIAVSLGDVESVIGRGSHPSGLFGRLFGSESAKLLKAIKREYRYRFEQDEVDDDDEPTLEQALADLLAGNELNASYGHKYAYAFELLCDHFGEFLDNSAWSAMRGEWADQVEDAMKQAGIDEQALSVRGHLMHRGPPVAIPEPDDFPFVGFLRKNEIADAARAIDSADLSSVDEEVQESMIQVRGWLERCEEVGCDLVCFYY
jgi:hypothetical protein